MQLKYHFLLLRSLKTWMSFLIFAYFMVSAQASFAVAPTITSGTSKAIPENSIAVYTPVVVVDPEGGPLNFIITGGIDSSKFTIDAVSGDLSFKVPPDFENPTDSNIDNFYDVAITVIDNETLSDTKVFTISVTDVVNEGTTPPVILQAFISVPENTTAVATPVAVSNPDGKTITFSITGGIDASKFTIDANSGDLSFIDAPDFENPTDTDANNSYHVIITIVDNDGFTDSEAFAITVTDKDEQGGGGGSTTITISLEEPAPQSVNSGIANLRGWAIGLALIEKVELFIDGQYITDVPSGGARADVAAAFPNHPGSDLSGFSMAFSYSDLSEGSHTAVIKAHDVNGLSQNTSTIFNVERLSSGFIADPNAVSLQQAVSTIEGEDIVVSNLDANGVDYDVRLRWRVATQQFEIEELTSVTTALTSFSIASPIEDGELTVQVLPASAPLLITLEEPIDNGVSNGIANLRGWAVGLTLISKIELFIDEQYSTDIPFGSSRADVAAAFPEYPNSDASGFSMAFPYSELSVGSHTALVRLHDVNGLTEDASTTFNVVRLDNAFITDFSDVTLIFASVSIEGEQIILTDFSAEDVFYTLTLQWQAATQQFEIQDIVKKDPVFGDGDTGGGGGGGGGDTEDPTDLGTGGGGSGGEGVEPGEGDGGLG